MTSPFHDGETEAQRRAGYRLADAPIRPTMPEQHRDFFAAQPWLAAATVGSDGRPLATILTGRPGFIASPDPATLRIAALPAAADPFRAAMAEGGAIGVLGLDLATRRRNRVNGRIATLDAHGFSVVVEQSFGNCPKYIQARDLIESGRPSPPPAPLERLNSLDDEARRLIAASDTAFVASASGPDVTAHGGADISHRGGKPGFVTVAADRLIVPDLKGNRYFNTLGNFVSHPWAALLFVDFVTGDLLHLSGAVTIDWSSGPRTGGAERSWQMEVEAGGRPPAALALRWRFRDWSPFLFGPATD